MSGGWQRARGVLARPITGGVMVLPLDGRSAGTLTGLDHDLWEILAEPATTDELTDQIARQRRHDAVPTEAEMFAALRRLVAWGVVRESLSTPPLA